MNYFELFEMPMRATIDNTQVVKKYRDLQKKFHPDFYSQNSESEKDQAMDMSAHINKAYNIFKRDDSTLEYFLQQAGVIEPDEKYTVPPGFLMEVMELNEQLAEQGGEVAKQSIAEFEQALKLEVDAILQKKDAAYSEDELSRLKSYYYRQKYLQRILDRIAD